MAHTKDAVVYDPITGIIQMVIIPDDDAQLADPAYNPPGMRQLRLDRVKTKGSAGEVTDAILHQARQFDLSVKLPRLVSKSNASGSEP